jgi:hypothetical protein
MIEKSVKIHDKFSLELKFGYSTRRKLKENLFEVNTWIFIPNSLDINRQTYDKSDFYKDLKSNIRLITPEFLLRDIADRTKSPFIHLEAAFNALAASPTRGNAREYEHQIKMFLSILKSSLRDHREHIIRNMETEDRDYLISNYLQSSQGILSNYRSLRHIIAVPTVTGELFSLYLLGDEFMSNLIEQHTFMLADEIRKLYPGLYGQIGHMLTQLISSEVEYRKSKGFPVAENRGEEEIRELIYRRGVLKKLFESQLFLATRKKKDGFIAEQLIYSIAAGFAMIFATGIAFAFQQKYGNFTIPLFVALVISYMLKDRIKELTRYYFAGKLKKVFFDHKTSISVTPDKSVGWCKESFDFVSAEKVPGDIIKKRDRSFVLEAQSVRGWEKVVLYRKLMKLDRPSLDGIFTHFTITGVNDIIRFNVSNFVHNMDNPEIPFRTLSGDGYEELGGQKVYYLTFVIDLKYDGENQVTVYRVTFNRSGILKVDSLP